MLRQSVKNKKKGFTIIEVVLVLAIAGLIFLMVFVAFPQLQRNQRDTQRRNDMARFLTAVMNYQTNNRNKLPFVAGENYIASDKNSTNTITKFVSNYLNVGGDLFEDPTAGDYEIFVQACTKQACPKALYAPGVSGGGQQTGGGQQDGQTNTTTTDNTLGKINVYLNATCDGESPIYADGSRKFAFTLDLEGAGTYCGQN
ncbi:type II secretion system protein [Candidatus Saccharibacteria bacterium]|nr:type II secretion system protein [Candidatus Saccharibacteria bacterium]